MRASAEIDRSGRQRFIHGHQEVAGPQDAALGAQGLRDRFAECNAQVFDSVVLVDIEIAFRRDLQIHRSVARHQIQHVIEEPNAARYICAALSIEIQANLHVRLFGHAMHAGAPHFQYFSSSLVLCRMMRAPWRRSCAARTRWASLPWRSTPRKGTPARFDAKASSRLSPR